MKKFYDTCSLLNLQEKAFDEDFLIATETLKEIEHIKTSIHKDGETKYKARHIIHLLDANKDKYTPVSYGISLVRNKLEGFDVEEIPDNIIISNAVLYTEENNEDIMFITDDICCRTIARNIFKLNVDCSNNKEDIYKGYKIIKGNTATINLTMENMDMSDWCINEYLIIENTDDGTLKEMRFDGEKFVNLKLPPSKYIKGKNSLQRCALDIMMNPNITIASILGGYGSGKTFISMRMALYSVIEKGTQSKILGVREVLGEGKEIGFLPGYKEEKIGDFFLPLVQQLDGGEFELESLKQRGMLEVNVPYYMKGTTYNETVMLVDEAEDLSAKQIKLIGTRLGENSKIYFAGDYKQSVVNTSENNALIRMCNNLKGNSKFGCIYLGEDIRSETSKIFADLFEQ